MLPGLLESMRIPLTSIAQPAELMGIAAAREIINRIQNPDYKARHTPIPGTLATRASTAFSPKIIVP
jgi:DNA-binding LacI/PurR family transcriptional regulator